MRSLQISQTRRADHACKGRDVAQIRLCQRLDSEARRAGIAQPSRLIKQNQAPKPPA
jgi:hypothetical protein